MNDIITKGSEVVSKVIVNEDYKILCTVIAAAEGTCACEKVFGVGTSRGRGVFTATMARGSVFVGMYVNLYRKPDKDYICFPAYPVMFVTDEGGGKATDGTTSLALAILGNENLYGDWQKEGRVYLAQRVGDVYYASVQGYGEVALTEQVVTVNTEHEYTLEMDLDTFGHVLDFRATAESVTPVHPTCSTSSEISCLFYNGTGYYTLPHLITPDPATPTIVGCSGYPLNPWIIIFSAGNWFQISYDMSDWPTGDAAQTWIIERRFDLYNRLYWRKDSGETNPDEPNGTYTYSHRSLPGGLPVGWNNQLTVKGGWSNCKYCIYTGAVTYGSQGILSLDITPASFRAIRKFVTLQVNLYTNEADASPVETFVGTYTNGLAITFPVAASKSGWWDFSENGEVVGGRIFDSFTV